MDIKDFIRIYRIKAIAFQTEPTEQRRRQWDGKPSTHTAPKQSRHFIMVISVTRQHISMEHGGKVGYYTYAEPFLFAQGAAHTKCPTAADLLECLQSDYISNGYTFEQWADDMGADKDSIAAHATFEQCQENTRKLEFLFGQAGLDALASVEW